MICDKAPTFSQNRRPPGILDRSIYATSTDKMGVRCIDDRVGGLFSDIGWSVEFDYLRLATDDPDCYLRHDES